MAQPLVEHVVADAGAFLKKAPLQDIGKNIYTLKAVVDEIRDKATRRSLAFLPYQLTFKEPRADVVRLVTEFSKKTGDYPSLSSTDIKVLALTFQLEQEHVGTQNLRTEPQAQVRVTSTQRHPETLVNVAGFHFPSKKSKHASSRDADKPRDTSKESSRDVSCDARRVSEEFNTFQFWREPLPNIEADLLNLLLSEADGKQEVTNMHAPPCVSTCDQDDNFNSFLFWRETLPPVDDLLALLEDGVQEADGSSEENQLEEDKENEPEDEDEDEDGDGGGWITPSNIRQVKMDSPDWTAATEVKVGCLTTDFAMQNVLIQMGLHVVSVNGMLIKQTRNYILRCHACFQTTSNMSKEFCPKCGNKTLKKIALTVSEDGSMHMHFSKNPKVLNPRGLRHSLPLPQGGKHSNNPRLTEDQRFPQQRLSRKARQKTDVFNKDYAGGASPFCENDVYSRAANLHIRDVQCGAGRRRANPNCARRKFVKK
ncbi:RNA-binding protein NOB1 isoform X5 [Dunckerocampus dactyliophorus]|uniref:RNA-binding protein NOB1 isoform X5 n=1 Tax=Dunckerocampus dactyliophorus TaxID=161453 RepID=UPI0024074E62|nr:RNA-binding protein NOB1 isoform X5 [Dunckerocampus dactyliophorus]